MNNTLKLLIKLQTIENIIETLTKEKEELPKLLKEIESKLKEENKNLELLIKKEKDTEISRRAKEKYLLELAEKVTDRKSKLFKVKTNEEYSALLKEIENLKKEISETEDEVIKLLYDYEEYKKLIDRKKKEIEELSKILNEKKQEVALKTKEIENKMNELCNDREKLFNQLNESTKIIYLKLKETKKKVVVPAIDKKCMGCFMSIPTQIYIEVKRGESIVNCPQCGRILYWEESGNEGKDND